MKTSTATTEQIRERMGAEATEAEAVRMIELLRAAGIEDTDDVADAQWFELVAKAARPATKTLKFKTTAGSAGCCTAQHPHAEVGHRNGCTTYEVTEVPDLEEAENVARLLTGTSTWLAEKAGRYSYRFDELGVGVILR